ncbi:MAG: DNA mismatch repair protein MutS, partial [Clostridiales Family XIII bacterium]|nr:DNA mismatch repair protein MutS [Clostridiales Family XIII bacterium]
MSKSRTVSPIMKQYQRIKNEHKEAILFFRLGDFYEMFYEDAIIASEVLEIVLTKKTFGLNEDKAPLAGIPVKTADAYIAKLVKAGYKIAICEQVSNAPTAKGLVDRKVVRIVSPGTATDDTILDSNENNFLLSIGILDDKTAIAYIDVSTGESEVLQIKNDYNYEKLLSNIIKVNPVEIVLLVLNTPEKLLKKIKTLQKEISQTDDDKIFEENFEIDKYAEVEILALNILFTYAERMCPDLIYYAKKPRVFKNENIMNLDGNTIRNLELLETLF